MSRNMRTESEFGLPAMPRYLPDGTVGPSSGPGIAALADADAIAEGAAGAGAGTGVLTSMGDELRAVYARGDGVVSSGLPAGSQ